MIDLAYLTDRCRVETNECLVWNLQAQKGRPVATIAQQAVQMRNVVWELVNERRMPKGFYAGPSCENSLCLHPDHLEKRSRNDNRIGVKRSAITKHRISIAASANSDLSQQDVETIRATSGKLSVIGNQWGISKSRVSRIWRNEARRDYSNPYAQLMQNDLLLLLKPKRVR